MKPLSLILLLTIIPLAFTSQVQAIPGYDPEWRYHLRIVEVSWITHDQFSENLVSKLDNYNLSKFSYILVTFTTEVWNPYAVSISTGSIELYKNGTRLVVESNSTKADVADLLGCFNRHGYPKTDPNDTACSVHPDRKPYIAPSGLSRVTGSTIVRFNQSGVLGWPEGNYSVFFWTGSTIPLYVVSNSSGVFQIPGEVPDDWGSIKGLGYSASLSGALPLSSIAILYGPILLVTFVAYLHIKKKENPKTLNEKESTPSGKA